MADRAAVQAKDSAKKRAARPCGVCSERIGKYKCPGCKEPYCSVKCYKIHKESCDPQPAPPKDDSKEQEPEESVVPYLYRSLKNEDFLKISSSSYMKLAIQNEELRGILKQVDRAEDRERELEKAMRTNCDFREFIDKMVDILDGGETVR
mmetsp:Transcript_599/g.1433  ORF Transcript_599/g.1433 Transcript_599/m.1433 type:complete len:150 (-) Transcript_599:243-692(-)